MRLLYVVREECDTKRPDVYTLFGKLLPALGVESDLLACPVVDQLPCDWPGGEMVLSPRLADGLKTKFWRIFFPLALFKAKKNFDAIVVRDKALSGVFFLFCARLFRVPMIYWASYPVGAAYESLSLLTKHPVKKHFYRIRGMLSRYVVDKLLIPKSRLSFLQSKEMVDQYITNGVPARNLVPVPMCVEWNKVSSFQDKINWAVKQDADCKLVYLGTLDLRREPLFMLRVLGHLRSDYPDLKMVFVGDFPTEWERKEVLRNIDEMALQDAVEITGWLPQEKAWQHLCGNVIGLSAIPVNDLYQVSSPTKTIEYLALGVPAVVTPIPDQLVVIEESGAGVCADMQVEAFAAAVATLLDDPVRRAAMAKRGVEYVREKRTYEVSSQQIYQHLQAIRAD
ncbi:glycosyltransferase involved in cell wall biosynthesis [Chitinivorax tropicus]|uniref:Glycosyltransferase involved in cell wall biosynthesis n=1 Tax=Chitinivorax tropicus TaxID=714531 RepID=A0A840MR68_9PROT|nr:glycosyltransferase [Chitinivorax tropicus]MBB5019579.1 glycosyltransferase involved in cell wall biosynthesis [Chitinivorax tropicus]